MEAAPPSSASVVEPELTPVAPLPDHGTGPEGDRGSGPASATGAPAGGGAVAVEAGVGSGLDDLEGPPFGRSATVVMVAATVAVAMAALALRFWTRSDLWLDEALTVNIAPLRVHHIPSFLRW